MSKIRAAAVSGMFYPEQPALLTKQLHSLLTEAKKSALTSNQKQPKALIVPHAGYIYSGLTAAIAYQHILPFTNKISRVVLLGPSHHLGFYGMAVSPDEYFNTPLGDVKIDVDGVAELFNKDLVIQSEKAHTLEHSLEVQLPFLQYFLTDFQLIPIVTGEANISSISDLLTNYLQQPDYLIIISSDLSHFLNYQQAVAKDRQTAAKITNYQYDDLDFDDACGRKPVSGLLKLAKDNQLQIEQYDIRNSGDTSGDKNRVVGYGAWGFYE